MFKIVLIVFPFFEEKPIIELGGGKQTIQLTDKTKTYLEFSLYRVCLIDT